MYLRMESKVDHQQGFALESGMRAMIFLRGYRRRRGCGRVIWIDWKLIDEISFSIGVAEYGLLLRDHRFEQFRFVS